MAATSYLPVREPLKAYFQIDGRDDARKSREKGTGRLVTLDPTLGPTLPAFLTLLAVSVEDAPWQALDPPQRRQRTLQAIKALLLRESQVQPLLLVCFVARLTRRWSYSIPFLAWPAAPPK